VTPAWSPSGSWMSIAIDAHAQQLYATQEGGCYALLHDLQVERLVQRVGGGQVWGVRILSRHPGSEPGLVLFHVWHRSVEAWSSAFAQLWTYEAPSGFGIDNVHAGDTDGDGADELLLSSGPPSSGLILLSSAGKVIWQQLGGDASSACLVRDPHSPNLSIPAWVSRGPVYVRERGGSEREWPVPGTTKAETVCPGRTVDGRSGVFVGGRTEAGRAVVFCSDTGVANAVWMPSSDPMVRCEPSGNSGRLAVLLESGDLWVVDPGRGESKLVERIPEATFSWHDIAWGKTDGGDDLLVVTVSAQMLAWTVT